jgi:hypothetical protein
VLFSAPSKLSLSLDELSMQRTLNTAHRRDSLDCLADSLDFANNKITQFSLYYIMLSNP